jgi:hypothetical protein
MLQIQLGYYAAQDFLRAKNLVLHSSHFALS